MSPRYSSHVLRALVVMTVSAFTAQAGPSDPVSIPDANLKQAIKTVLGIAHDPTEEEMLALTNLTCTSRAISSLVGLQYAANLTGLHVADNRITDVSALGGLTKLAVLSMANNQIGDITALSGLTNLESLDIRSNPIGNIAVLSGLTKLTELYLGGTRTVNLSPLASLTWLTTLFADHAAQGGDLSALSGLTYLTRLRLADNGITDVHALSGLKYLTRLTLTSNRISDIGPLSGLKGLTNLDLDSNLLSNVSALSGMGSLAYLNLSDNQISDLSPLAGTTALLSLYAGGNRISDLSPLRGLPLLAWVYLGNNRITDISGLYGLTTITELSIPYNLVTDISPLASLTYLNYVCLSHNQISDLSPMANLLSLRSLLLDANPWNADACLVYVPIIRANNPGISITGDACCAPTITQHPQSQTVQVGGSATFAVAATGTGTLSYQWRKGGVNLSGATGSSYTINPVHLLHAGTYDCIVTSGVCSKTSNTAVLTVLPGNDTVHFNDASLKYWVETTLGKTDPTRTDMLALTSLEIFQSVVADLTGLEYALNLQDLDIDSNPTSHPRLTDISPLAGLTQLRSVRLHDQRISDLAPLAGLANLKSLNLHTNTITNLTPLAGLTGLTALSLENNQSLSDLSALSGLANLTTLELEGCEIGDISPLSGMTKLTWLELLFNPLDRDAFCHDLQVIKDNNPLVWFTYGQNENPPGGVAATDGAYTDRVRISWQGLCPGPGGTQTFNYVVYRSDSPGGTKTAISGNLTGISFDDTTAAIGVHYSYWVKSDNATVFSDMDVGWSGNLERATLVVSSGEGGSVTTPGEGTFIYTLGTSVPVAASADAGHRFLNWTGTAVTAGDVANPAAPSTTVKVDNNYTLMANFAVSKPDHSLTVSSGDGGDVTVPGEGTFTYADGTLVAVTATAAAGYHFVNWTGTAVTAGDVANPAAASTTVKVDSDFTLVANFAVNPIESFTLTVSSGDGGAATTPGEGTFTYPQGTLVAVVATADPGYRFAGWTGTAVTGGDVTDPAAASTTVHMHTNFTLIANFVISQYTLTTSSGDGGAVSTPGEGTFSYAYGTAVPVAATAEPHYHFVNWTGTAVTAGRVASTTSASTTVTMDAAYTLVANFALDQVTLTASSGDGGAVSTPGEGTFTYAFGTAVPVAATAEPHYHFVNWTGTAVTAGRVASTTSASTTVTMDAAYTLVANFALDQVTLTASSGDGGAVSTPGEGTFTYAFGTAVPVAATAEPHYHFVNWTGTAVTAGKVASTTSASTTVTMDAAYTLVANFALDQVTLTASSGDGGAVSTPGEGTFSYAYGTAVPVTATAEPHYHFVNWTGTAVTAGKVASETSASTTVTVDAAYTLVANFALDTYSLTITASHGSVTRTPDKASYAYGETVTLNATATTGYEFDRWAGDQSGTTNPVTLAMDGNKTITANFTAHRWSLTVSCTAGGAVLSPGQGTFKFDQDAKVILEARPDPLFRFVGWQGSLSTVANPYALAMDADYTLKACFESVLDHLYIGAGSQPDLAVNGTLDHPFSSIQAAIEVAKDGAKLTIRPGTYLETIDLSGKDIEINGLGDDPNRITPLPVIDGQGKGTVVRCTQGEDANTAIIGLVITGGSGNLTGGILCAGSSPTIEHCLIVGNRATGPDGVGGGVYCQNSSATFINCTIAGNYGGAAGAGLSFKDSHAAVVNSIVWGNGPSQIQTLGTIQPIVGYTDVQASWVGVGNLDADPLFAAAGYWARPTDLATPVAASDPTAVWVAGDYHVRSQAGRWYPVAGTWLLDAVTSPCIDSGNPASPVGPEPLPNGNRINLGAYGGTNQASRTRP